MHRGRPVFREARGITFDPGHTLASWSANSHPRDRPRPMACGAHLTGMTRPNAGARLLWCRKELGHVMLHGPDNSDVTADAAMHRGIAEVEAESVALMVGAAHGLATDDYTIPYVASWASSEPGKTPVAVVVAHQTAGPDGCARLRLPAALLASRPGTVVLLGHSSGFVAVSGSRA